MQVFKKIWFFIILVTLIMAVNSTIQEIAIANDDFVQERNKSVYRILREAENSVDTIVVGDSLSYTSFSPMELWREYGITSYICGQSGQTTQETFYMLKNVFKNQTPGLIIMETHALFKEQPGLNGIKEMIGEIGNYYLPLLRNHDIWKAVMAGKRYHQENYKGFSFRCDVRPYTGGEYMKATKKLYKIPPNSLYYMKKIIKLCKANDAKLLLVSVPSPENYNYSKHNSIQEYAKKHSLVFLDMNLKLDEIGIDWKKDSLDGGDHLNLKGARKATAYLGEYLKKHYKITDHRNEDGYKSWNTQYIYYNEEAEKLLKMMK